MSFPIPSLVKYKNDYFFAYSRTKNNNVKLLTANADKYSGCPSESNLEIVESNYPIIEFNGGNYVLTKQGVISCRTGDVINSRDIKLAFMNVRHPFINHVLSRITIYRGDKDLRFEFKGRLSYAGVSMFQMLKSYDPCGYSLENYKYNEDKKVTTWSCWASCD